MTEHGLYHRFRTIHGILHIAGLPMREQFISVVPSPCFLEIHFVLFAEPLHFLLRKSKERRQLSRVGHRIFGKHVECRMRAVFLDRQDAGHVGQRHIVLILEPRPQEIEIFSLSYLIVLVLAEQTVPFINQDDKGAVGFCVNILEHLNEIGLVKEINSFE